MNMFGKNAEPASCKDVTSIIGKEMRLTGDVDFKSTLRLDGRVEGNVKGECLILGVSGKVIGDVEVDNLACHGHVEGNVQAGKLHLMKSGTISGRVETSDLLVESGAQLNGEINSRPQDLRLVPGISGKEEADSALSEG
jgi:cytoskeletal protein CcmA (bactofilin family)